MERLTERYKDSIANIVLIRECGDKLCEDICGDINCDCSKCELEKALEKLATYEDLEEQGLLVRLPCKVGDTVYVPTRNFVSELRITMVSVDMHGAYFSWMLNSGIYPNLDGFSKSKLGKTVFLTREEAEKKLEEMKKNG